MSQDAVLLNILEQSGFIEKEARVYLALLELSQGTVNEIAKISGLKRPIIYVILEGLIKRGYVNEVAGKKINTYQASDPSMISAQLQSVAKNFSSLLPILKTLGNKGKTKPKISYFETKEGVWKNYEEANYCKEAFFITSLSRIAECFPDAIDVWKRGYQKGFAKLSSRTLIPNNAKDIEMAEEFVEITNKVEIRILPELKDCNMDFALYGNKLSIASFGEEFFMAVIDSENLAKSIKPIFEIAWRSGRDVI